MPVYTNPTIDQEVSPKQLFYVDNKCAIFTCNGSPEGVILANTGSIALSDNGSVFKKTTDDVNTGWVELTGGTISSPLVVSGTNPTLSFVDTDVGDDDGTISMQSDQMSLTVVGGTPIVLKSSGFIVGIEKTIQSSFGALGANVGGGLTTMFSGNIPANTLAANNDFATLIFCGGNAVNDNDKRLQLTLAGTVFMNTALLDIDTFGYTVVCEIGRIDSTHIAVNTRVFTGSVSVTSAAAVTSTGFHLQSSNTATFVVADLTANAISILFESQGVANNDVVLNQVKISACQMS